MLEEASIDDLDYAILKVVREANRPLWKTRIHELIEEYEEELPLLRTVTLQTVSRRVDELRNTQLLDATIIEPDELPRDLVIGFTITQTGIDVLAEKRCDHIGDLVRQHIFEECRQDEIREGPILAVFQAEFDLDDDTVAELSAQFDPIELVSMLTVYYTEAETADVLSEQTRDIVRQIARDRKNPAEAVETLI